MVLELPEASRIDKISPEASFSSLYYHIPQLRPPISMPEFISLYIMWSFRAPEDAVPDADPSARIAAKAASVDWI